MTLRRLRTELDRTRSWRESRRRRSQAAKALRISRKHLRAVVPAHSLGNVLVVYFDPPTAASEIWCIRVDLASLQPIGDPIRFTQQWAWLEHAQAGDWWQEWASERSDAKVQRVSTADAPTKLAWFK